MNSQQKQVKKLAMLWHCSTFGNRSIAIAIKLHFPLGYLETPRYP